MKNEKWLKEILANLNYWQDCPLSTFYYHPLYRVGVGKSTNLDFVFGEKRKLPLKNLRKFSYFSIKAPFPDDAVIFFQPSRQRMIVASKRENKVFKISTSSFQLALRDAEISLLKKLETSEFAPHSAKLLEVGSNWIVTSFCSNKDSLLNKSNVEKYLLKNADPLIMNPMARFYRSQGTEKVHLNEWVKSARVRASGHPSESHILQCLDKIEASEVVLLRSLLHFDLHAGNVLKDCDNVVIIDWEVSHPGLVLVDYFDFYRRYLNKNKDEQKLFFAFFKGEGDVPPLLAEFYKKFEKWGQQFQVPVPEVKLVFWLYALERTLIYWDKWKQDRVSDRKGLESKIINLIFSDLST